MANGERTDPTLELRCAVQLEAVATAEGPIAEVGQTPQNPTITLSRQSCVGLRECPALRYSPGLHAVNFQSKFHWDWDSLVLFVAALSYFMKKID